MLQYNTISNDLINYKIFPELSEFHTNCIAIINFEEALYQDFIICGNPKPKKAWKLHRIELKKERRNYEISFKISDA